MSVGGRRSREGVFDRRFASQRRRIICMIERGGYKEWSCGRVYAAEPTRWRGIRSLIVGGRKFPLGCGQSGRITHAPTPYAHTHPQAHTRALSAPPTTESSTLMGLPFCAAQGGWAVQGPSKWAFDWMPRRATVRVGLSKCRSVGCPTGPRPGARVSPWPGRPSVRVPGLRGWATSKCPSQLGRPTSVHVSVGCPVRVCVAAVPPSVPVQASVSVQVSVVAPPKYSNTVRCVLQSQRRHKRERRDLAARSLSTANDLYDPSDCGALPLVFRSKGGTKVERSLSSANDLGSPSNFILRSRDSLKRAAAAWRRM